MIARRQGFRLLLVAGTLLGLHPVRASAVSPDDPFSDWGLEWYRIVRTPDSPSGGILPVPDPPGPLRAPVIRAAGWTITGLHSERPMQEEEADGLSLKKGGSVRLLVDLLLPVTHGVRIGLAGRGILGEAEPTPGQWLERNISWRSEHLELLAGRSRSFWGDGSEGSLLLGRTALAPEMARVRTIRPIVIPGSRGIARFHGSIFLSYLDDRDREVPFPLLQGTRIEWEPSPYLRLSGARTILLGGAGRTQKLTLSDLWDIWWGRDENRRGARDAGDTDQKASFGVELRMPPMESAPAWFDGARFFYEYAGEDAFHGLLPTAVAHFTGGSLGLCGWLVLAEFAETVDDANWWYTNHTVYGPQSYYYKGYVMGHPMGPNGTSRHLRLWTPTRRHVRAQAWFRSRGHYDHWSRKYEEWDKNFGIKIAHELSQSRSFETGCELLRTDASPDGPHRPPVQFKVTVSLRVGGGMRQDALTEPASGW